MPRGPQRGRSGDGRLPLLLRHRTLAGPVETAVGRPGVGHHAAQLAIARQDRRDAEQPLVTRRQAAALAVAVDLDQHRDPQTDGAGELGQPGGCLPAVADDGKVHAPGMQPRDAFELAGLDAHGVEQVRHAGRGELLGLLQRRDRCRAGGRVHHPSRDVHGLAGLQVRAQLHAARGEPRPQAVDVALHGRFVEQQRGRRERSEVHARRA